jgi:hypothetical protein
MFLRYTIAAQFFNWKYMVNIINLMSILLLYNSFQIAEEQEGLYE